MESLIYYSVIVVGILIFVACASSFGGWIDARIHEREVKQTENEDDPGLVLMFNGAMRAQFSSGITIGALGILIIHAIYSAPTAIGPMLTAAGLIVMAIWFAKDRRKHADRAREQMKQHIVRYYIDSSPALREVIREAVDKGRLGPSFDESREAWAARLHLNR